MNFQGNSWGLYIAGTPGQMRLEGKQDGKSNPFPKELFKAGDLLPDPAGQMRAWVIAEPDLAFVRFDDPMRQGKPQSMFE